MDTLEMRRQDHSSHTMTFEVSLHFLDENGFQHRRQTNGYGIRHQGHWMALTWNKAFHRYTADRRLTLIVQSFVAFRSK